VTASLFHAGGAADLKAPAARSVGGEGELKGSGDDFIVGMPAQGTAE